MATYLQGMGEELTIPHTMFVLRGPSIIVVDTSFASAEAVKLAYPQEVWRGPDEEPAVLLRSIGIEPGDVDLVICTHLHYDHCGTNRLFRARVLVQRRELEYALDPTARIMQREFFSPAGGFEFPADREQMVLVDGDTDLGNGLVLLHLPGHTPGLQGVIAETERGRIGILGDHVMVEENWSEEIPVGLHTSVDDWYRSTAKAKAMIDFVAPSHDLRLFPDDSRIARIA